MSRALLRFHHDRALTKRTQGRVTGVWSYTVRARTGKQGATACVFYDGTGGRPDRIPAGLFEQAARDAAVVQRMEAVGHRFATSWADLVDEASERI